MRWEEEKMRNESRQVKSSQVKFKTASKEEEVLFRFIYNVIMWFLFTKRCFPHYEVFAHQEMFVFLIIVIYFIYLFYCYERL